MPRRIPKTRRHKKLKFVDPCYSGPPPALRKRKALPNEPPSNEEIEEDQQDIPASMRKLITVKNKIKQNQWKNKKKKKKIKNGRITVSANTLESRQPGMTRRAKSIPNKVVQRKYESHKDFFDRLQRMADMAMAEAKIEAKYDADIVRVDKKTGEASFVTWKPEEAEPSESRKRKRLKEKEKKDKKKKTGKDEEEKDFKKDNVKFGEVVREPPNLAVKPRKAADTKVGARDLVLSKMLQNHSGDVNLQNSSVLSKKRRLLEPDQRKMLEAERHRAVDMYRLLKKKKNKD